MDLHDRVIFGVGNGDVPVTGAREVAIPVVLPLLPLGHQLCGKARESVEKSLRTCGMHRTVHRLPKVLGHLESATKTTRVGAAQSSFATSNGFAGQKSLTINQAPVAQCVDRLSRQR